MSDLEDLDEELWDFATGECSYCHNKYTQAVTSQEELLFSCGSETCLRHNDVSDRNLNITFKPYRYIKCTGC